MFDPLEKEKILKKRIKIAFAIISSLFSFFGLFLFLLLIMIAVIAGAKSKNSYDASDYTKFTSQVEAYRNPVAKMCEQEGIVDYVNTILSLMQVSTQGQSSDPMASADKISNTEWGKNRGDIKKTSYSIECGVKEFKELLSLCNVKNSDDNAMLAIVYEAYNLNRDYVEYAKTKGEYSVDNAASFISSTEDLPNFVSSTFSTNVAAFVKLKNSNYKQFIHPLSIYTILCDYNAADSDGNLSTKTIYKGANKQGVLSAGEGLITAIETTEAISKITIETKNYILIYEGIKDCELNTGQTIQQGNLLGYTSELHKYSSADNYTYGIYLEITKDGVNINPEDILDLVTTSKQPLDKKTSELIVLIAQYSKICVDSIKYKAGNDDLGLTHDIYSNFFYTDEPKKAFDLPYDSYDNLANYENITYSIDENILPVLMYEGDVIFYKNEEGNYDQVAIYVGESMAIHMSEKGCVLDFYNFRVPCKLIRFVGKKFLGLMWPLPTFDSSCISSEFSPDRENPVTGVVESHNGTDFAAQEGAKVIAAGDGTIISSGWSDTAGYNIIIDHGKGVYTYYMHASQLLVEQGATVKQGNEIMLVGTTGQSTGNHLHFGLMINKTFVNPMDYTYKYTNQE